MRMRFRTSLVVSQDFTSKYPNVNNAQDRIQKIVDYYTPAEDNEMLLENIKQQHQKLQSSKNE
jgi:hypothetical protein